MTTRSTFVRIGIAAAIAIGIIAVFCASSAPDGLESTLMVIQGKKTVGGEAPTDVEPDAPYSNPVAYKAPLSDYSFGAGGKVGEVAAVLLGIGTAFLVAFGISRFLAHPAKKQ